MSEVILRVENLTKFFDTRKGKLHAVDNVSFTLEKGKTLGIVGESGCGKSTTGRTILRLIEPTSGKIYFEDKDITQYNKHDLRNLRQEMQIIFQDPFASLDPRMTTYQIISEPIVRHKLLRSKEDIMKRVYELMDLVGLAQRFVNSYPHELDGGRRQRIGIARALALRPKFIVCDEPVSALDVSIQAQILNLLKELQQNLGLSYIFITHDLSVVHHFADDIAVMYLGRLVEKAKTEDLFREPLHPYTQALLSAIPTPDLKENHRILLKGEITSPVDPPDECRFLPRCLQACDACKSREPELLEVRPNHFVSCCRVS